MYEECGKTGCAGGGGTFALFVFAFWVIGAGFIIFNTDDLKGSYFKEIPQRILALVALSGVCWVVGWLILKVESFLFG